MKKLFLLDILCSLLISCGKSNRDILCGGDYKYWIFEADWTYDNPEEVRHVSWVHYFDKDGKFIIFDITKDGIKEYDGGDCLYSKVWEIKNDSILITSNFYDYKILDISEKKVVLEPINKNRTETLTAAPDSLIPEKYRRRQ